ncbi:hypothetical protein K9B35_19000 [Sphingomonas sp. R647]|uniref:hypothetical protein n=1 Tax=Sphingomonas sp. R647 TaxID=2875233 RepID=UPI001CD446F0|nr:hypothetical protein [Sphingomonas sp. R647]MCA1200059.1 hypothetical protein [Sphingomonas sp. R647]
MENDRSPILLKEELLSLWESYSTALEGDEPEAVVDAWIGKMDQQVPHGTLSDLLFWGERERTPEEAIQEAICREMIWRNEGELALLIYRERSLEEALSSGDDLPPWAKHYSESELPRVRALIASLTPKTVQ